MTDVQPALDRISELLRSHRKPQPSYFVVMSKYDDGECEAVVSLKHTRSDVIDNIKTGQYRGEILFIHHIDGMLVEDVTRELIDAAESDLKTEARDRADQIAAQRDHAYDLRKHEVA